MSRFAGLKQQRTNSALRGADRSQVLEGSARKPRDGKKMIGGYYTPELSRAVNILAAEQGVSIQALLGEALDDVLRKHGKHPFGER